MPILVGHAANSFPLFAGLRLWSDGSATPNSVGPGPSRRRLNVVRRLRRDPLSALH